MWFHSFVTGAAMLTTSTVLASAQSSATVPAAKKAGATPAPTPCMADSNARRFDFWVGEWDVTPAGDTAVVGHSVVQIVSGGCALLENWTASNGSQGKSLNSYNASLDRWQQFWVGQNGGVTEYRDSHWDGSTLIFEAHSRNSKGNFEQRLSFTPIDSNTVRQLGEISTDGGTAWSVGYDFYYHRRK
jgi:hypothetical protein